MWVPSCPPAAEVAVAEPLPVASLVAPQASARVGLVAEMQPSNLKEPLVGRDLDAARRAYEQGGNNAAEASRAAHSVAGINGMAVEHHEQSGGRLKGIVFGGLDGILTSFAIIAGSVGAKLSPVAMLALGVSNVLADALSMGAGEFLSSRSYNSYVRKEREREAWELENYPAGEIAEMVELFVARGMSREDASFVIQRSARRTSHLLPCRPLHVLPPPRRPAPHAWAAPHVVRRPSGRQWRSTRTFSSTS